MVRVRRRVRGTSAPNTWTQHWMEVCFYYFYFRRFGAPTSAGSAPNPYIFISILGRCLFCVLSLLRPGRLAPPPCRSLPPFGPFLIIFLIPFTPFSPLIIMPRRRMVNSFFFHFFHHIWELGLRGRFLLFFDLHS